MRILITVLLFAAIIFSAKAQIKSGGFQIDGDLKQINVSAHADFGKFRSDLSVEYNLSEERINYYHTEMRMEPADIYFALEISRISQRPIERVIEVYKIERANGWGEIAKDLGIKPGSAEFHALKNKAGKKSLKYKGSKNGKNNGGNKEKKGSKHSKK